MNSVSFLIFWLIPLLPAGEHGPSLRPGYVSHLATAIVRSPYDVGHDAERKMNLPGAAEWDEEDSSEDLPHDAAHVLFPLWGSHDEDKQLSFRTHLRLDHAPSPSQTLPLLC